MNNLHQTLIINATLQLQKEYDHICFQYNVKLSRPIILIESLADSFGKWDGNRNVLTISENLIFKYEWHKVISVLKHEMAHQIVTHIFRSNDAHGTDFIRATQWLGLDSYYSKATLGLSEDIPDWKNTEVSDNESGIFRKVEKLLGLSESSNEHEAFLAMGKVRELYKKYNLERFANNAKTNHVSLTINLKSKRIQSRIFLISHILQEHFFVSSIFSKMYDVSENNEFRCFVIMGEKHNVLMAEHVYEFLLNRTESLWKTYQIQNKLSSRFKASYQKGVLEGFTTKLDVLKKTPIQSAIQNENALVRKYELQLIAYVKTQFPRTSSIHQSGLIYKDHYDNGTKAGRLINLARPISKRTSSSGIKLLESRK